MGSSLRYVEEKRGLGTRVIASIHGAAWSIFLMGSLILFFNVIQCLSFLFLPFSRKIVWQINRWCGQHWWEFLVYWTEKSLKVRVKFSGDEIPVGENAMLISNHLQMPDIPILMTLAIRKKRLGDMKWFVKDVLKYVPGLGWGMVFLGCVFLKRNWFADRARIEKTFGRLRDSGMPFWLVSFVEGTRIRPSKLLKAQEFAKSRGLPIPQYTLLPRAKGFAAAIEGLSSRLDAVYDATLFYEEGIPSLWQYSTGLTRNVRFHVRRYPIATLPKDEAGLSEWLRQRYVEKDALLAGWEREFARDQVNHRTNRQTNQ